MDNNTVIDTQIFVCWFLGQERGGVLTYVNSVCRVSYLHKLSLAFGVFILRYNLIIIIILAEHHLQSSRCSINPAGHWPPTDLRLGVTCGYE